MSLLALLQELQHVHDSLATIDRDLSAFPPDLAQLHKELQSLQKRQAELEKGLTEAQAKEPPLARELSEAQVLETHARKAVKASTSKTQYTAAIRELDTRERLVGAAQKPLGELRKRLETLRSDLESTNGRRTEAQAQFDELHALFLSEHENQVTAQERLRTRKTELETALPSSDLQRFNRLLAARQGKAVAMVEGTTCLGCRTKLRIPLMTQLREQGWVTCESCQRFIYLSPKA